VIFSIDCQLQGIAIRARNKSEKREEKREERKAVPVWIYAPSVFHPLSSHSRYTTHYYYHSCSGAI
jgi:hypothetical protein